jgi:drug/metabolite transporter (DMT)-like permease
MLILFAFYAFYGLSSPLNKLLAGQMAPLFIVGIRGIVSGSFLFCYHRLFNYKKTPLLKEDLWPTIQFIFFYLFFSNVIRFWALQYLTSIKAAFLYSVAPFVTYLFAYLAGIERITVKKSIGLCIGFLGFVPLLITGTTLEQSLGSFFCLSWPELAVIGSAICDAYGLILISRIMKKHHYEPLYFNSITLFAGGILSFSLALVSEKLPTNSQLLPALGLLLLIIFISNIVSYNIYTWLVKKYSATFLSLSDFLRTLFSTFYGFFFLKEHLSIEFFVAAILIFIGLFLFYQEEIKENKTFVTPQFSYVSSMFKSYKDSIFKQLLWWKKKR